MELEWKHYEVELYGTEMKVHFHLGWLLEVVLLVGGYGRGQGYAQEVSVELLRFLRLIWLDKTIELCDMVLN